MQISKSVFHLASDAGVTDFLSKAKPILSELGRYDFSVEEVTQLYEKCAPLAAELGSTSERAVFLTMWLHVALGDNFIDDAKFALVSNLVRKGGVGSPEARLTLASELVRQTFSTLD